MFKPFVLEEKVNLETIGGTRHRGLEHTVGLLRSSGACIRNFPGSTCDHNHRIKLLPCRVRLGQKANLLLDASWGDP